jgi:guanylate kinase
MHDPSVPYIPTAQWQAFTESGTDIQSTRSTGVLLVLSAPSGAGKSTITKALMAADPKLRYSISSTTRPKRGDEVDGRDYFFIDEPTFEQMIANGEFYEYARVHGNLYGTRKSWIEEQMAKCRDVVLDIDVQGSLDIKRKMLSAVLVFVLPPSFKELERRLRSRGTEDEGQIRKRLDNARREVLYVGQYDYVVVNENLPETIRAIQEIIAVERRRSSRLKIEICGQTIRI